MKSFTIFEEYDDLVTLLPKKDQPEMWQALIDYMFRDKEPDLNEKQIKIFKNLKRPLDKSKAKSKATSKQNQNEIKTKSKTNQKENKTKTHNMSMSNVNVNVKSKFIKPSIEEIQEYCNERKNGIPANAFYDFYESKDWYVGKNKMKDWKACIRTWEQRKRKQENVPEWFDKKIEGEKVENKELEELLKIYE